MNKKNLNYSLIFSALFLLGMAGIISYGYMGYMANITNNATLNAEVLNPQNILDITGDVAFDLNIDADNLSIFDATDSQEKYIDDTKEITISASIDESIYAGSLTCDYEFYYKPEEAHTNSNGIGSFVELGFNGECSNCLNGEKFDPVSVGNVNKGSQKTIYKGSITTDAETGKATQTWSLHFRFYNLNVNQSGITGKHPSGKIVINGKTCYPAKKN